MFSVIRSKKTKFEDVVMALEELNPEVLKRKKLRGIDTLYDERTDLERVQAAFTALCENPIRCAEAKKMAMEAFDGSVKALLLLLPEGADRNTAEQLLEQLRNIQEETLSQMLIPRPKM